MIVQELLGEGVTEQQDRFLRDEPHGTVFRPDAAHPAARMEPDAPHPPAPFARFGVEELADHVTQFTLAGIRGIRQSNRKSRKAPKKQQRGQASK